MYLTEGGDGGNEFRGHMNFGATVRGVGKTAADEIEGEGSSGGLGTARTERGSTNLREHGKSTECAALNCLQSKRKCVSYNCALGRNVKKWN